MNASIDDKIKQLDELSMRAINFDKDFNEIGEVKRKLFLLIKYCFGENSAYMNDYNKIEVPEEDDDQQINAKNLKQLQRAVTKLLEIMDTMTEDLQISKSLTNSHVEANKPKSNNIFIVHGTDHKPAKELNNILKEAGLTPIILHEQPSGSMTIIEKLEKYSHVGFAFIVLTPDDSGVSKKEIRDLLSAELGKENATTSDVLRSQRL